MGQGGGRREGKEAGTTKASQVSSDGYRALPCDVRFEDLEHDWRYALVGNSLCLSLRGAGWRDANTGYFERFEVRYAVNP